MIRVGFVHAFAAAAVLGLAASSAAGCASTEFHNEGPGQPSDRASGAVPPGLIGVCKRPGTKRPPIVDPKVWDDARPCTSRTPASFVRLGYGREADKLVAEDVEADKAMERAMQTVAEAVRDEKGRVAFKAWLRGLRDIAVKDPRLKDRVFHPSASAGTCDTTYMLDTTSKERAKLEAGSRCAAQVYDAKVRAEACLFDTRRDEVVWLTSAWPCVSPLVAIGEEESCHRMCAYDDYCARQVSCSAPDFDLLLCALGVCLPERREGF